MKNLLILFVLLFTSGYLFCQSSVDASNPYFTLLREIVVTKYDFLNQENSNDKKILFSNYILEEVSIVEINGTAYSIIKPTGKLKPQKLKGKETDNEDIDLHNYYATPSLNLENNKSEYTHAGWDFRIGYSVIPVKVYPFQDGPLDFAASSISQGATIGLAHQLSRRKSNIWMTYNFSMNFTKVTPRVDDFTENFEGNDLAALSPAFGVNLNYNNAEFGIYIGRDYLPGSAASKWRYNGVTWYSIAIGTSFGSKQ